eukprot:scaffold81312_cov23-Tisochrysis_lutea.AAC.3
MSPVFFGNNANIREGGEEDSISPVYPVVGQGHISLRCKLWCLFWDLALALSILIGHAQPPYSTMSIQPTMLTPDSSLILVSQAYAFLCSRLIKPDGAHTRAPSCSCRELKPRLLILFSFQVLMPGQV